jgi:hypothetical protein
LIGRLLDFGCGWGFDANFYQMDAYDPFYFPRLPQGEFNTITCTYVINVLLPEERMYALRYIHSLLARGGSAYITVRRDVQNEGWTKAGTYQENAVLGLESVRKCASYEIYRMRK